jgi:hypothetical protein
VIREAVDRIPDLETAMFPVNATVAAHDDDAHAFPELARELSERGMGVLAIKTFAKQPWPDDLADEERPYNTWYEPYDDPAELRRSLRFTLSQDGVTTLTNAGDPRLVDDILDAAADFEPMDDDEQAAMVDERRSEESPVPTVDT